MNFSTTSEQANTREFAPAHSAQAKAESQAQFGDRFHLQNLLQESANPAADDDDDARCVVEGLSQCPKVLPPRFFYDDYGSLLFEQICQLPEYYPTRTETAILKTCAPDIARTTGACELVELGSGSSTKTRILLDAYDQQQLPLRYMPIDVSAGILEESAKELLHDYPNLKVFGLASTYQLALQRLMPSSLPARMIAIIGSTLGNLNPSECDRFLHQIATALERGDYFLLGIDLQKPKPILEAAYNDSQGVTAAFNLNMLRHLNRRFNGNFALEQFEHLAFYSEALDQIEMHLRSRIPQTVRLEALDLTVDFEAGETIHSEISRKFDLAQMQTVLASHGLTTMQTWTDDNQWFGVVLAQRT
jgi:dimethylhistidine N-methyltransferase